jgi:hypothetical protein
MDGLGSFGNGQATGGAPGVVERGDNGQERSGIESQGTEHDEGHGGIDLAEQYGQQREDLGAGAGLAVDAGTEVSHAETDVEKRGNDQNAEITAENQDCDAAGHEPLVHEHQEQGAEQELVGDRIEILADLGLLLEQSCRQAIQAVAEPCYDEKAKRGAIVRLKDGDDQKGYEAQTQESEQVRGCAEFFQQSVEILRAYSQES